MGGFETIALGFVEPTLKYRPCEFWYLTEARYPGPGPCMVGSLTGAVASQRVTEAREGGLKLVGNQLLECNGISPLDCEVDGPSRDESRP